MARKGRDEKPDLIILGAVALLLVIGLIMVYSAKLYFDQSFMFLARQASRIGIGIVLMAIGYFVPLRCWRQLAWPLMALLLAFLVLVWLFGSHNLGAVRSFHGIQPSEFAKPVLVLFLAHYYQQRDHLPDRERTFKGFALIPMLACGVILALIALQPAVSMAAICFLLVFTLMFLAEVRWWQMLGAILILVAVAGVFAGAKTAIDSLRERDRRGPTQALPGGYQLSAAGEQLPVADRRLSVNAQMMADGACTASDPADRRNSGGKFEHVVRRVRAYLNWVTHIHEVRNQLWREIPVDGQVDWQQRQSWIAIGSGGLVGKGLGNGKQKLYFLPKVHTDFIFGLIGEEWGFVGSLAIFMLFLTILWRGMFLALRAQDTFSRLLTAGLVLMIVYTAIVHLGVTLRLMPPTGQTLPLVSYGGSALAANMRIGLVLQLSKHILRRPIEDDLVSRCWNRWAHLSGARAR
jgi:cell division protein FtsW (lipid II flippase)